MNLRSLFFALLKAGTELEVQEILSDYGILDNADFWHDYGNSKSNYGIFENQQSHPVAALVEKITNGIDAILERRCWEAGIDPKSELAPRTLEEALDSFFPQRKHWDLQEGLRKQAQEIQIVADGPKLESSLLVYDNGIGQKPEDFPSTFLSLLRGNKNDIHFVQGKYNMGGTGAIAFCGEKRYQLIASKHYEGKHPLGFTLIRRHPSTEEEYKKYKSTWFEYLVVDGKIPSIDIESFDAGLEGREFSTGSLVKLYTYRLPKNARSIISRDLNRSLNEYLFDPALPFLTKDDPIRYSKNFLPSTTAAGLKHRLNSSDDFLEQKFVIDSESTELGKLKVEVFVFNVRAKNRDVKQTKDYIRREYFLNNMSVLFSLNGQVHGSFTSEFITRTLKFGVLRDYLLIHVDCTELHPQVRNELFMASRDRLKNGTKSSELRDELKRILSSSELREISKRRRANLNIESGDKDKFLQDAYKTLTMNDELSKLLKNTLNLFPPKPVDSDNRSKKKPKKEPKEKHPFNPQRYPSAFQLTGGDAVQDGYKLFKVPLNGNRTLKFSTDVENEYFSRTDDPGQLEVRLLKVRNDTVPSKNTDPSDPEHNYDPSVKLNVTKTSPTDGTIKVSFNPGPQANIGDTVEIDASLSAPGGQFDQTFLVQIVDKQMAKPKPETEPEQNLGLPQLILCSREGGEGMLAWEAVNSSGDAQFDEKVVVEAIASSEEKDGSIEKIIINMDSSVYLNYRSKLKYPEQLEAFEKRFIYQVYFHCLFLYTTTRAKYEISEKRGADDLEHGARTELSVNEYISGLFSDSYAQFLVNFDMNEMMEMLS